MKNPIAKFALSLIGEAAECGSGVAPRTDRSGSWGLAGRLLIAGLLVVALEAEWGAGQASTVIRRGGIPHAVDTWENDDGLPQNSVIAMGQGKDGYLWLGTLNGLVRFDGVRFTVFDESTLPGLPSSQIVAVFEDRKANLWLVTESAGVARIGQGGVQHFDVGVGQRHGRVTGVRICEDASGAVWLYTPAGELVCYRDNQIDVWRFGAERPSQLRTIIPRAKGSVWVGTDWGLWGLGLAPGLEARDWPVEEMMPAARLDFVIPRGAGGTWRLANGRVQRWSDDRLEEDLGAYPWGVDEPVLVSAVCEDQEGNLVVGTRGEGVFWWDDAGEVMAISVAEGLSHAIVLSLLVDREGNLWVGTDGGGLNRIQRQDIETVEATRDLVVQSVTEDAAGVIWIGYNGGNVDRWHDGRSERLLLRQAGRDLSIRAVLADREGRVWVGTWGGGLFQWQNDRFVRAPGAERLPTVVQALYEDPLGVIWAGTQGGLARWDGTMWQLLTTRDGLPSNQVRAMMDDGEGGLWVGTETDGLARLGAGTVRTWRKEDGLPADSITFLWRDAEGRLWVGTAGGGLGCYDGGRWVRITTRQGLVSNSLGTLVEDERGDLWVGSNAGLMRLSKPELIELMAGRLSRLQPRVYRKQDGLPTREGTAGSQPGAWRGRDGRLWFPTIKGLAVVDPATLRPNPHAPPVVIESVWIEGESVRTNQFPMPWDAPVVVAPDRERVEIFYTSLNLRAPDRSRFRFRLQGHETIWTETGTDDDRMVRYSRLPPGQYRFEVTASNEDGVWNAEPATVAFVIEPPFWRTWWFLSAATSLVLAAVIGSVYYASTQRLHRRVERLEQQQALERERARIARDLHDQLGASLTQISLLGEMVEADKTEPEEVEAHARQISSTSRETTRVLDEIVWAVNPSNDTLDGLVTYFCKNAQEYLTVAGLRCRLEVPAELPRMSLPPEVRHNFFLAAKEAVTNIVRHAEAAEARIRLRLGRGDFTLEVEDNGKGMASMDPAAAARRNGLKNMRRRMDDIHGRFELEPGAAGGTVVRLTAPLGAG
jgi:ligand-binding sensor domain-containing protein/signal transduction histidine kinase